MSDNNRPAKNRQRKAKESKEIKSTRVNPRLGFFLSVLVAIFFLTFSYFKKDGFKNILEVEKTVEIEQENLERIKAENEELRRKIKTARSDAYQVEKFAREKLNLAKKDELVFRFHEAPLGEKR